VIENGSIKIEYNSHGTLLVKEKFSKQAKERILQKPKIIKVKSGESIVLFINPGVTYELSAFTFAP
jgi:hypothetical protein